MILAHWRVGRFRKLPFDVIHCHSAVAVVGSRQDRGRRHFVAFHGGILRQFFVEGRSHSIHYRHNLRRRHHVPALVRRRPYTGYDGRAHSVGHGAEGYRHFRITVVGGRHFRRGRCHAIHDFVRWNTNQNGCLGIRHRDPLGMNKQVVAVVRSRPRPQQDIVLGTIAGFNRILVRNRDDASASALGHGDPGVVRADVVRALQRQVGRRRQEQIPANHGVIIVLNRSPVRTLAGRRRHIREATRSQIGLRDRINIAECLAGARHEADRSE